MAVKISHWVWQHSGAKGNDLLVLLALADNANDDGVCWPSLRYLAEKTRLHENTIRSRLKSLRGLGIVGWDERPGSPNVFRINTDTPIDFSTPTESVPLPTALGGEGYTQAVGEGYNLAVPEPSITISEPSDGEPVEESDTPSGTSKPMPLPKPFIVTADMKTWAATHAASVDVMGETKQFVAYWREGEGKGKRRKNWSLTWMNWMRRQQTDVDRRAPKPVRRVPSNDEWMYR